MFRKTYLIGFLTIALFLIGSMTAMAQNGPVRGKIEMTKADGSKVGVPDVLVEAYRLDIKASFQPSKTDKKGYFSFAGLPIGAKIVAQQQEQAEDVQVTPAGLSLAVDHARNSSRGRSAGAAGGLV